jgi:hypothetical protein
MHLQFIITQTRFGWNFDILSTLICKILQINPDCSSQSRYLRLLVGKPVGKRPLGRPKRRWIDSIKMVLLEIGLSVVDWIGLAQYRYRWRALVNAVMNHRVP